MKSIFTTILLSACCIMATSCHTADMPKRSFLAKSILVEAEHFQDKGGWLIDAQFPDVMGSSYLLAHGLGKPVENAVTQVEFPSAGTYKLWVRTKDWAPGPWKSPGRFQVLVNATTVETVFGINAGWAWQSGGTVEIADTDVTIELQDLTGFDGRCDALLFTKDTSVIPPDDLNIMHTWRTKLSGTPKAPAVTKEFDVVIVGGGLAGCAAALSAAEQGLNVALIHDRYILGGNASGEIRVNAIGITGKDQKFIKGIGHKKWRNGSDLALVDDVQRHETMDVEKNIQQFLGWRAYDAVAKNGKITHVDARYIETGKTQRFVAPVYIDCTGDGWIGYWAGAEYRYGRESSDEFNEGWDKHGELWSPKEADNRIMGPTLLWNARDTENDVEFPELPWAKSVAKDYASLSGQWSWEYSHNDKHQIYDAEAVRDYLFKAIYGSFVNAKKKPENAKKELEWVGYLLGKRESRRLMGDHIFTMKDAVEGTQFPDAVVEEVRELDVHYQQKFTGRRYDFLSEALLMKTPRYYVPFRSLYSRNITNLMMAGRCFSCSHVGLGGPRVMNTTGQMGIATGYAASLCKKYDTNPRGIYQNHITELRTLIGYK